MTANSSYYERHVFFCLNERKNGEDCCANHQAQEAFDRCKAQVKAAGLSGPGKVRVNKAGCLDRCAGGPVAVVYPEAVWYTYVDAHDIDEIVQSHLKTARWLNACSPRRTWDVDRMNAQTERLGLQGAAGKIEALRDTPGSGEAVRGVAVIAHPHPLFGGTMDNKVVQTLARAFVQCGWVAVRFNFRGVGASEGVHDAGRGETLDLQAVAQAMAPEGPLALAGFSFGAFVAAGAVENLWASRGIEIEKIVLVGTAASRFNVPVLPEAARERALVIHGEQDDTVPLTAVMDWARSQSLPVTVVPGIEHFFHGQLPLLKNLVVRHLVS